jgi:hypothetical protein
MSPNAPATMKINLDAIRALLKYVRWLASRADEGGVSGEWEWPHNCGHPTSAIQTCTGIAGVDRYPRKSTPLVRLAAICAGVLSPGT